MNRILMLLFVLLLGGFQAAYSQKKDKKYNEGTTPKVKVSFVGADSLKPITYLKKDKETKLKIVVEGGIDKVKSEVFVTSKNAIIRKVPTAANEYIIIPQSESCEIIVDVKTLEIFYAMKENSVNGKVVRGVEKVYEPKTYMVGYESYEVR